MHSTTLRRAAGTIAGLLVLCALIVRRADEPPDPVPASAPATEFSAERAFTHVREIAQPLAHDVMIVITDGEEAGLLGAAAFVREHPWAKDVGVTLNFEARGTSGRSYMFETGAGNLDVARMLRRAGDVSATSLSVTVY